MVEIKQRYFPEITLKDLRTTIGVVYVCKRSCEILSQAADKAQDAHTRRSLNEVVRKRMQISNQLIPATELDKPAVASIKQDVEKELSAYNSLQQKLVSGSEAVVDRGWIVEFHRADREVLKKLRIITRKVESRNLATRLSALVASIWLSGEKLHANYVYQNYLFR